MNTGLKAIGEAFVIVAIIAGLVFVSIAIVDHPFAESVYVEAHSVRYPDVDQSVFFSLGHKSGQWTSWDYDDALPVSIVLDEDSVYYFYVDWYIYSENENGTDFITIQVTSEEYIITKGLLDGNNGTLVFKPFNDRLRVTFTVEATNILGGPVEVI